MTQYTAPDIPALRGPVPLSHLFIRQFIRSGDHVIDATCGNGNDTQLLAELVGPGGRVWAFDIQQKAIDATSDRLSDAGCAGSVEFILASHETLAEYCDGPVTAVVFNLGYLPGGDRSVITRPASTLKGVEQALELLAAGGIVAITIYPGHEGGSLERTTVEEHLARLAPGRFDVWRMGQINVPVTAPYLILVQKVS
jgi:SAM-dependent methyltransferase